MDNIDIPKYDFDKGEITSKIEKNMPRHLITTGFSVVSADDE